MGNLGLTPQDRRGGRLRQGRGLGGYRRPSENLRVLCHLGLSQASPFYRRNSRSAKTPDKGLDRKDTCHPHCFLDSEPLPRTSQGAPGSPP